MEILNPIRIGEMSDKWSWELESSGIFTVKSTRNWVNDMTLPMGSMPTRWNRFVPIKINIFYGVCFWIAFW